MALEVFIKPILKSLSDECFLSLLRSIHLAYVEDVEVKGIQAYRFAPPNDVLMSPKNNPANAGFCVPAGDCLGTGVLKVSVCREGRSTEPSHRQPLPCPNSPIPPHTGPMTHFCFSPHFPHPSKKRSFHSATLCPGCYLTFPLFEQARFYSVVQ